MFDNIFLKKSPNDVRFTFCLLTAVLELINMKARNLVRYLIIDLPIDLSQWIAKTSKPESRSAIIVMTNHSSMCESNVKLFISGMPIV